MPEHHPQQEELLEYATGAADEWLAVMVACHLTFCPRCRDEVALLDALGGALLGDSDGAPVVDGALEASLSKLDAPGSAPSPAPARVEPALAAVPRPLHPYLADPAPRFRWLAPGITHLPLELEAGARPVRLLRFRQGYTIPAHGHSGLEWLMVLDGELDDDSDGQRYGRGDVCRNEPGKVHVQRVTSDEPCLALVANLGPLIPQSWLGRLLARVVRI